MLVFSFGMCWLRYRFRSVWAPVLGHNLHNCILIAA